MAFSYQTQLEFSNTATPRVYPWEMDSPPFAAQQFHELADTSPSALQLHVVAQDNYEQLPTIVLQERASSHPMFRFDNMTSDDFERASPGDEARSDSSGAGSAGGAHGQLAGTPSPSAARAGSGSPAAAAAGSSSPTQSSPLARRSARSAKPYQRPQTGARVTPRMQARQAASEASSAAASPQAVHSHSSSSAAGSSAAAVASALMVACPAMSTWSDRYVSTIEPGTDTYGAADASAHAPRRVYKIATDVQLDTDAGVLVAVFELPGVKRADVRVRLAACPVSRALQLVVAGVSRPRLVQERGPVVRQRKCGAFAGSVAVPFGTTAADVRASMEDGLLTVTVPMQNAGVAAPPQDVSTDIEIA